jgi:hypothetical protein
VKGRRLLDGEVLELAVRAYGLIRIDVTRLLETNVGVRRWTIALVRRLLAAGCDAHDCVRGSDRDELKREVHALARAVRELTEVT